MVTGPVLCPTWGRIRSTRHEIYSVRSRSRSLRWARAPSPERFRDFDDQVAVNLRFPGGRIATMLLSYSGADLDDFRIVGTLGDLYSTPAFAMPGGFKHTVTVGEKKSEESFRPTDQFGGELKYFSDCIQRNKHPEADGEEGSARRPHHRRVRACAGVGTTCRSLIPMRVSCARQRVKHRSCTKLMNRNLSASISRATAADRRIDDASATSQDLCRVLPLAAVSYR